MRVIVITVAAALSLALHCAAAVNDALVITETGENFSDLKATYNGAPFAVLLTGAADGWTVQLPLGYSFSTSLVGTGYFFAEPGNPALFNQISITAPTFLLFSSEVPAGQTFGTSEPNPFTIVNAGTNPNGIRFDLTLADTIQSVPDNGATAMFLGIALGGVCLFRRFARLAA